MIELCKKVLFRTAAVTFGLALPFLIAEGIYSLARGPRAETSLAYALYSRWFVDRRIPEHDPGDPTTQIITDVSQIEELIDAFKADGVGIGNSPFRELKSDAVALNREENGCKVQKPNLHKTVSFLRSNLFNPFDQITYFHDTDRRLSPEVERFLERYQFRQVRHTSNQYGERTTVPDVDAAALVLVAGDSIANGVMLGDDETIASQLQGLDRRRRYVNLGVSGASAADIVCALEKAADR